MHAISADLASSSRPRASAFSVQIGSFWRSHGNPYSAPARRTLRFAQAPTPTVLRGCIAMSGTAGWSNEPPGEGAHALVFFTDVVRVELADSERSELGMLDVHDLSRCRVQRNFEASS